MKFNLGTTLRDRASGFEGIATGRVDFLTGNVQYNLQPPAKDGALPDPIGIDAHQLEQVAEGKTISYVPAPKDVGVVLGEKYEDIVSGIEGIAVRMTTFLNGCVYVSLQHRGAGDREKELQEHFIEWKRLKRKSAGVTKALESKTTTGREPPGGPNTRVPMRG